jgi:hypothetical protein
MNRRSFLWNSFAAVAAAIAAPFVSRPEKDLVPGEPLAGGPYPKLPLLTPEKSRVVVLGRSEPNVIVYMKRLGDDPKNLGRYCRVLIDGIDVTGQCRNADCENDYVDLLLFDANEFVEGAPHMKSWLLWRHVDQRGRDVLPTLKSLCQGFGRGHGKDFRPVRVAPVIDCSMATPDSILYPEPIDPAWGAVTLRQHGRVLIRYDGPLSLTVGHEDLFYLPAGWTVADVHPYEGAPPQWVQSEPMTEAIS